VNTNFNLSQKLDAVQHPPRGGRVNTDFNLSRKLDAVQ
jgi:hypothetical protein